MPLPSQSQSNDVISETVAACALPETARAGGERHSPSPPPKVLGQYELLELIGEGGMGQVYRARHTKLQRDVAVKLMMGATADSLARFSQEMVAAGRIDAPHIVRTTDAGEADGISFLVMEYIDGVALDKLLHRSGPLRVADACELVRQAAEGVAHLESLQMTHRDLKPGNLILDRSGEVKILDLGLAKLARAGAGELTKGFVIGTLDFMAPEQARDSAAVDSRCDLYSLGATLYYLLAGEPPLGRRRDAIERLHAIATERPVPLVERRPDVPAPLSRLVDRLLAKVPDDRPSSAAAVAEELRAYSTGAKLLELVATGEPEVTATCAVTAPARFEAAPSAPNTSRIRAILLALVGLLAVLGVAYGIVMKLKTRAGEILVELEQPGATLLVDDEEQLVVTSADRQVYRVSAVPGQRKLKVLLPDGTTILSKEVEVQAGRKTALFRAELVPEPVVVAPASPPAQAKGQAPSPPPPGAKLITVAQDGSADCRSIGEALELVAPEGVIRILDNAEYKEQLALNSPSKHQGVTIESPQRATIVGALPRTSVIYVTAPRVTLRGLAVRAETSQVILCCVGLNSAGTVVEDLEFRGRPGQEIQAVSLEQLHAGDPPTPVQVRRCHFRSCAVALRVSGIEGDYRTVAICSNIAILDNVFESNEVGLRCLGDVRNLLVAGNRFVNCSIFAVQLEQLRGAPRNLWVLNNSLIANRFGFRVWDREVVDSDIHVLNNLTVQSSGLDWAAFDNGDSPQTPRGPLDTDLLHERWQVRGNWREGGSPDKNSPLAPFWLKPGEHDRLVPMLALVSRNAAHADFLRPAADSPLATGAANTDRTDLPKFVGALPPAGEPPFDWQPLVKKLLVSPPPPN